MAKSKIALSLFDLLKGIGKTEEKLIEKIPEAAKVPVAKRRQTEGMTPAEVIDFYNKEGLLGKYRTGVPAVADLVTASRSPRQEIRRALPNETLMRFMTPEELAKPMDQRNFTGYFVMDRDTGIEGSLDMYPSVKALLEERQRNPNFFQRVMGLDPVTRHLTTTMAPPDVGSQGYQMAYDVIRGAGDVNVADILTPRNVIRRPLNVANYGLARGDYRNVMPLSDKGVGVSSEQLGQQMMGRAIDDSKVAQQLYLKELLGDEDAVEEAMRLDPTRLAVMGMSKSPQAATGYLSLVNAMRSALGGPLPYRQMRETVHPGDLSTLKRLIDEEAVQKVDKSGTVGAFGPGALGRARTAEAAVSGLRQGMTPDEIVEEITKNVPIEGYFGRYAQGGGVKKYKMGGLSALQEPVVKPSPDPLVEIIMRQIGVEPGTQPTPAQLQQFNDVYNQMLERQRIKEETYDYPFREHDAVLG